MRERVFDRLLARCLGETMRTGDMRATLARHPREAHALRPLVEAAVAATKFYREVPAPRGGLQAGRNQLLSAAAKGRARLGARAHAENTERRQPMFRMALATKLAALILSLAMGTTALGGGAVWAANDSLPGDAIYPIKRVAEEFRLSVSTSLQSRVMLALRFAAERGEEARRLAEAQRPIPAEIASQVATQVRYALQQAGSASPQEGERLFLGIAENAEEQARLTASVRERLHAEDDQVLGQIQAAFQQGRADALEAVGLGQGDQDRVQDRDQRQDQIRDQEPTHAADQVRDQKRDQARDQDHEEDGAQDRDRDRERQYEGESIGDLNPSAETEREREQERTAQDDEADDEPEREQEREQERAAQDDDDGPEREQEREQERAAQDDDDDEPEREQEREQEMSPQDGQGAGSGGNSGQDDDDNGWGSGGSGQDDDDDEDAGQGSTGGDQPPNDDAGPDEHGSAGDPGQDDAGSGDDSGRGEGSQNGSGSTGGGGRSR